MQIKEAKIFNFGKLQKKEYKFSPGINVIYGANEAGKTTLHNFLMAMLFGMEKNRGRAAAGDMYTRYEPWHAPSFYSGAIRFTVEGRPFYLERNFYHREKRELLRNEGDGEELSVAYGDLAMLLGGIEKEAFGNTYDVPQCGTLEGKELTDILAEYLSDAAESGDGSTHVAKAVAALETKKKELNADIRKRKEHRQREHRELEIELELLEKDCHILRTEIEKEEAEQKRIELSHKKEMPVEETQEFLCDSRRKTRWSSAWNSSSDNHQPTDRTRLSGSLQSSGSHQSTGSQRPTRIWGKSGLLVAMLVNLGLFLSVDYPVPLFGGIEILLGVFFVGSILYGKRAARPELNPAEDRRGEGRDHAMSELTECEPLGQETAGHESAADAAWNQAKRILENQRELLLEKETRRYNISERLTLLAAPEQKEQELAENIEALDLASSEIQRLAKEYGEEMADELNAEVSRFTSLITGGIYDSVRVDDKGMLKVTVEGREIAPEALSRGTLEQFYLAFRIAVGNIVAREEPLPLFLDETFCMYDDVRLAQTLSALARMKQQIFIFTCQRREMELLEELGITYQVVNME